MSVVTKVRSVGVDDWVQHAGLTIEEACRRYVEDCCYLDDGESAELQWQRDDGSTGTLTATMRHVVDIRGMREPMG